MSKWINYFYFVIVRKMSLLWTCFKFCSSVCNSDFNAVYIFPICVKVFKSCFWNIIGKPFLKLHTR